MLLEIPGFLTPEECDYIMSRALNEGLYPSGVNDEAYYSSLAYAEEEDQDVGETDEETATGVFEDLDVNDDMVKIYTQRTA